MPQFLMIDGVSLHVSFRPGKGRPVVFSNSLGTDFRIWDGVVDLLPDLPILRMDKRGHGLSGDGPTTIPRLAEDVADVMDHFELSGALVCGVSVGGLITQQLAHARPDLATRLVLSNTGMKIGTDEVWNPRIETAATVGMEPLADPTMQRWFSPDYIANRPADLAGYRTMLTRTPGAGYATVSTAIRDCDLTGQAAGLMQPTTVIAGGEDGATPPALNRALADAVPNAQYVELDGIGHLPCLEVPQAVADVITDLI